jgi:hypothetical protein
MASFSTGAFDYSSYKETPILSQYESWTQPKAEIHQALLSYFSLLAEFLIAKVLVKDRDSRVLKSVNLNTDL